MDTVAVLKALADESRMKIIILLSEHCYCVGALADKLDISRPAVSQHMNVLAAAGLVCKEKRGYYSHYRVNFETLEQLAAQISRLAAAKNSVASEPHNNGTGCRCHIHHENSSNLSKCRNKEKQSRQDVEK